MKNRLLPMLMAMSAMGGNSFGRVSERINSNSINTRLYRSPIPSNSKRWIIDGKEVWAVTKKAAIRKANKL